MKIFFGYFKDFFSDRINLPHYIYTAVFLTIAIWINYTVDFEDSVLDSFFGRPMGMVYYSLFYFFAYYLIAIPGLLMTGNSIVLKDHRFWIKSAIFLLLIGIFAGLYHYLSIVDLASDVDDRRYLRKILSNFKRIGPYLIILYIIQRIFDKKTKGIYGLRIKGTLLKPYFILLLIVVPLIVLASFQDDFLQSYPRFRYWTINEPFGLNDWIAGEIFELFYSLDFVSVELIFRGALIIGMMSVMGKEALLPMVATYAFLHFGKPLGETVSSIFGGYILGVIAYQSKHIMGGVIVHIGIALLMEATALLQYIFVRNI